LILENHLIFYLARQIRCQSIYTGGNGCMTRMLGVTK